MFNFWEYKVFVILDVFFIDVIFTFWFGVEKRNQILLLKFVGSIYELFSNRSFTMRLLVE